MTLLVVCFSPSSRIWEQTSWYCEQFHNGPIIPMLSMQNITDHSLQPCVLFEYKYRCFMSLLAKLLHVCNFRKQTKQSVPSSWWSEWFIIHPPTLPAAAGNDADESSGSEFKQVLLMSFHPPCRKVYIQYSCYLCMWPERSRKYWLSSDGHSLGIWTCASLWNHLLALAHQFSFTQNKLNSSLISCFLESSLLSQGSNHSSHNSRRGVLWLHTNGCPVPFPC